jgi:hypothetical protein
MALITTDKIKELTGVNYNTDESKIEPFIEVAEKIHLYGPSGVISKEFYLDIINVQSDNKVVNSTLRPYINDYISRMVIYEALPTFSVEITTQGLVKNTTLDSTPAEMKDLAYLRRELRETARSFSTILTDFLNENFEDYPFWIKNCETTKSQGFGGHIIY